MELLWQLIKSFWFILIISVGLGQTTGCMDDGYQQWSPNFGSPACNYNEDATKDDGSCEYPDCNGVCDGTSKLDQCGVCEGGATAEGVAWCGETGGDNCCDCLGVPNGSSYYDACDQCVGGETGNSDAFDIGIDSLFLKISTSVQNYRIPIKVSSVDTLNSFYMELDYDSTDIQIVDISKSEDIINNYDKLVHYDTISNNTSFNKRVIFNLFYSPKTDCSQYTSETVCEENNGDCSWNDNTVKCEQNQFANECDSTDVMFKIKLNTSVVENTTSISIHNLVLNEHSLDSIRVWEWDITISDPQECGVEQACNTGDEGACVYPDSGYDCDGNCVGNECDDCDVWGGGQNDGDFDEDGDDCEIYCPDGEEPDCNDDCGGTAEIDIRCGEDFCVGGNTEEECIENCSDSEEECTGDGSYWDGINCWNGSAYKDFCGNCIIAGSEDIDCFRYSFNVYNSNGNIIENNTIPELDTFYVSLYMYPQSPLQELPDSLEGIRVNLGIDTDILSLDDWSLNPNDLNIEGDLTGELESSYISEGSIDTTFRAFIYAITNEFYQGDSANILFLQFSSTGTNGDSALINYNEIRINETRIMKEQNYTQKMIYFGDCNGVFNGQTLFDDCGVCGGSGAIYECLNGGYVGTGGCYDIADDACDCAGNTPEDLYVECVGVDCDCDGNLSINESLIPQSYTLSQNYPNPFNPITYIQYSVPQFDFVTIEIININGQKIKTIIQSSHQPGNYEIMWDGTNQTGMSVPSGIYFYKMDADEFVSVKKLVLLK